MIQELPKKIECTFPPALSKIGDKRYLCGTGGPWIEVPMDTKIEEVMKRWVKPEKTTILDELDAIDTEDKEYQVENSKKNGFYTVTNKNGHWSCTCPGYGYRRKCRHIEEKKTSS